jgi:hypothetical protein
MRQSPNSKRSPMIAIALLAVSLQPAWAMYKKEPAGTAPWASFPRPAEPIAAPAPAAEPSRVAPAAITGPFLPIIVTSIRVTPIVFTGSASSDCQGTTGTSFTYGIKYLCADVVVDGAQGQVYRFSWTVGGRPDPHLDTVGTINAQLVDAPAGICSPQGNEPCGSAIPRGTYQVSFFLNNVQYQTAKAVIS